MRILPPSSSSAQRATWWLCLLVWCQPLLIGYIITVLNKFTNIPYGFFYNFFMPGIYILLTIIALPYISKKLKPTDWLFYIGFLGVFWGSYFFVPENREYLSTLIMVIPFSMLPLYFLGVSFEVEPLKKQLYYLSVISIVVQLVFFRLLLTTNFVTSVVTEGQDHYMHLSYQVLPYVLYVIWFAFENTNWKPILFSIVGSVLILLLGTRGAFLSILVFIVSYLLLYKLSHWSYSKKMLVLIGGVLVYLSYTLLLSQIMDMISSYGGSTRIVGWLLGTDESAEKSSMARIDFAEVALYELKKSGYIGLGFAGDRLFLEGYWVHNFILECLVSYGIFFGVLIPVIIIYRLAKGVMRDKNGDKNKFLLLLIGLGMIPILLSGSYVAEPWFYLMLGYCSQTLRTPKLQLK